MHIITNKQSHILKWQIFTQLKILKRFVFCLLDCAGGLAGYEILKVHDADPFLGVEVKFVEVAACQQFLESYSSGAVLQSLCQHASRLLSLSQELRVETQLKASTHTLDLCLDNPQLCLQQIHLSQVSWIFLFVADDIHADTYTFTLECSAQFTQIVKLCSVRKCIGFRLNSLGKLDHHWVFVSLSAFVTRRLIIWSSSCRFRPFVQHHS